MPATAKAYVLVMEAFDALNGSKIVADILTQGADTRTVEYPDPGTAESYGVVDKVGHILQSFVDSLASEVNLLAEIELTLALGSIRRNADERSGTGYAAVGTTHGRSQTAELDGGLEDCRK